MKAIVHTRYGPPDALRLQDVARPVPGDHEVLVKIHAATVSSSDCNMRNLTFVPKLFWLPMRLQFGLTRPKVPILGLDLAGEIAAVGQGVTRFSVGDPVFGTPEPATGTHAQYICLPEDGVLAQKPDNMSYRARRRWKRF